MYELNLSCDEDRGGLEPDCETAIEVAGVLGLALVTDHGDVAGHAMFWADPRTGVGLVEPMRVEDAHSGRGLAGTLLRAGLNAPAAHGCHRVKVTHELTNPAAERVYLGAASRSNSTSTCTSGA